MGSTGLSSIYQGPSIFPKGHLWVRLSIGSPKKAGRGQRGLRDSPVPRKQRGVGSLCFLGSVRKDTSEMVKGAPLASGQGTPFKGRQDNFTGIGY